MGVSPWSNHLISGVMRDTSEILPISVALQEEGREKTISTALAHADHVVAYAEATKQAVLPVYDVFKPADRKRTDLLTKACHDRAAAQTALEMAVKNLNDSLSQTEEHSEMRVPDEKLVLKLALATTAIKETTENVKAVAEGLAMDAQYGDAVNEVLAELRVVHAGGVDLFNDAGSITQPLSVEESSIVSLAGKKEALQKSIQTAEATLEYATELMPSVISPAHRFFQGFWGEEEMTSCKNNLQLLHQQLKAEIVLMKVAINQAKQYHSEFESSSEGGLTLLMLLI